MPVFYRLLHRLRERDIRRQIEADLSGMPAEQQLDFLKKELVDARYKLDPVSSEDSENELEANLTDMPDPSDIGGVCPIHGVHKKWAGNCGLCLYADYGSPEEEGFTEVLGEGEEENPPAPVMRAEDYSTYEEAMIEIRRRLDLPLTEKTA